MLLMCSLVSFGQEVVTDSIQVMTPQGEVVIPVNYEYRYAYAYDYKVNYGNKEVKQHPKFYSKRDNIIQYTLIGVSLGFSANAIVYGTLGVINSHGYKNKGLKQVGIGAASGVCALLSLTAVQLHQIQVNKRTAMKINSNGVALNF